MLQVMPNLFQPLLAKNNYALRETPAFVGMKKTKVRCAI